MSETVTYSVPAIHCAHCGMSIREEVSARGRSGRLPGEPRGAGGGRRGAGAQVADALVAVNAVALKRLGLPQRGAPPS